MSTYKTSIEYLFGLHAFGIKPGLTRIKKILKELDHPQLTYPSVLIGGTNGKGSTAAMLASILQAAGYRVGLYTSPHLINFNERIRVNGIPIKPGEIVSLVDSFCEIIRGRKNLSLTFFEFTTAMAFKYFQEKRVDIAVVEVGLGGRLDATNVLVPLVSVITSIGKDHGEYLGSTLSEIALEKAGIIKKNKVVLGFSEATTLDVFKITAKKKGAKLFHLKRDFNLHSNLLKNNFDYTSTSLNLKNIALSLTGEFQFKNAASAVTSASLLNEEGFSINELAIRKGLGSVKWPGRFEILSTKPSVILDCAHNPDAARALAEVLKNFKYRKLFLVLGIMTDKDIGSILKILLPLAGTIVLTEPKHERRASVELINSKIKGYNGSVVIKKKVSLACKEAVRLATKTDAICVSGSIFTVGEAKKYFNRILS